MSNGFFDAEALPIDRYAFQAGQPLDAATVSRLAARLNTAAWKNSHDRVHFGFSEAALAPRVTLSAARTAGTFAWPSVGGYAVNYEIPFLRQRKTRFVFAMLMVTTNRSYPLKLRLKSKTAVVSFTAVEGPWSSRVYGDGVAPAVGWARTPTQYVASALLELQMSSVPATSLMSALQIQAQIDLPELPFTANASATAYLYGGVLVGSTTAYSQE